MARKSAAAVRDARHNALLARSEQQLADLKTSQAATEEVALSQELADLMRRESKANASFALGEKALQQALGGEQSLRQQDAKAIEELERAKLFERRGMNALHEANRKVQRAQAQKESADQELAKARAERQSQKRAEEANAKAQKVEAKRIAAEAAKVRKEKVQVAK